MSIDNRESKKDQSLKNESKKPLVNEIEIEEIVETPIKDLEEEGMQLNFSCGG
ncbi:hypothetical protein [Bacillus cereus]|uniref:hypothetical protein n=1 Tax=Bacillus cereus TaxID=1396 RepID=UPI0025AFD093|nr:hypothetical protein [Bacillus cereus]MDA2092104.1 hypothetical protein [Bacillus cereus]WJX06322.1 hypothetical protein QTA68_05555 [Bacillus cereus]